jgi:hypothetical protein
MFWKNDHCTVTQRSNRSVQPSSAVFPADEALALLKVEAVDASTMSRAVQFLVASQIWVGPLPNPRIRSEIHSLESNNPVNLSNRRGIHTKYTV